MLSNTRKYKENNRKAFLVHLCTIHFNLVQEVQMICIFIWFINRNTKSIKMDFRGFIFLKRKDKKLNLKNNVYAKNFKKNLFKKKWSSEYCKIRIPLLKCSISVPDLELYSLSQGNWFYVKSQCSVFIKKPGKINGKM